MTEPQFIGILGSIISILVGLLAWIGMRIFNKLDSLAAQVTDLHTGMQKQMKEGDDVLHSRINEIDRRVVRVETRCSMEHEGGK